MKVPAIDRAECTMCMGCVEMCPAAFIENKGGYIQVAELEAYPEDDVKEAIKYCPFDCISWEEQ